MPRSRLAEVAVQAEGETQRSMRTELERGWTAHLELEFACHDGRTTLSSRRHVGPLIVQRPFFPESRACHVYVVHPPGGVVGGDDLQISVRTNVDAHALLTTPAATKFYRCPDRNARQKQELHVDHGVLEWLPQETIFYRGARARNDTIARLSADSCFIGWEIPCLGLPARAEPFDHGELNLGMQLWIDDRPRFIDRLHVSGESVARTAAWGLAGHEALGTLLAYPATSAILAATRSLTQEVEFAATLVDGVLVCRGLGAQAESVKRSFVRVWQAIRPLMIGREAVMPRIWAT